MKEPYRTSPDTYLLGENDRTDAVKYEYVNGQVYAMAGQVATIIVSLVT